MTWATMVLDDVKWKPPVRFVFLIMANRADEEGMLFPSVRWIKKRTGLGESTIRQATRQIQHAGFLIKEGQRREDGGQSSNRYRLAMNQHVLKLVPPDTRDRGGVVPDRPGGLSGKGEPPQEREGPGPGRGPQDTKEETKEKKKEPARATRLAPDFQISDAVRAWAKVNGHELYLEAHFDYFVLDAQSRSSAKYVDWDKALMKAITADWGNVRKQAEWAARASGAAPLAPRPKMSCRYCPAPSQGNVGGIHHCGDNAHHRMAMDGEPAPAKVAA